MTSHQWKTALESDDAKNFFAQLYLDGDADKSQRYLEIAQAFSVHFGEQEDFRLFSAPGRTELGGNHTDHQNGRVLAAGVTLDMIAAAAPRDSAKINFVSRGFPTDSIDIRDLHPLDTEQGRSASLLRGVCAGFARAGYRYGGFDACQLSDVPRGSGLSSSAALEILIGTILNVLYNGGAIPFLEIARIGQYAENEYFGKPSGLMDQTACAAGGVVYIDFQDIQNPVVERLSCDFNAHGYALCIVNTGGSHADLTQEYAAIPAEMRAVASAMDCSVLGQADSDRFFSSIAHLRRSLPDRALLRAMHFFFDNDCVARERAALLQNDMAAFLSCMTASGLSSESCLQNIYPAQSPHERSVSLALALTRRLLQSSGACRVHGGGFAGTIQAVVPVNCLPAYTAQMSQVFGANCCYPVSVRPFGGLEIPETFQVPSLNP